MSLALWTLKSASILLPIVLVMFLAPPSLIAQESPLEQGLLVITTFPSLVYDMELILAPDDEVISIVPVGVDPHDYQLTPYDIELLRKADLIISTAHTSFEIEIKRLHDEGEIRGVLVEIPYIPGMRMLENPATGQLNYHMPIYDPRNYMTFIFYLRGVLADLRPERADYYRDKSRAILVAINKIVSETPRLYMRAAADLPSIQYAVNWLGIEIAFLLIKEHDIPATPADLLALKDALEKDLIELVVISEPVKTSASEYLEELAKENGLPVLYIPSPLAQASILEKLSLISRRADELVCSKTEGEEPIWWKTRLVLATTTAFVILAILSATAILYVKA